MSERVDIHVIAERVAEAVNKRLAEFDKRISNLESRVRSIELEVATLRTTTIRDIVRSLLEVDIEKAVNTSTTSLISSFESGLNSRVNPLITSISDLTDIVMKITSDLNDLRGVVENFRNTVNSSINDLREDLKLLTDSIRSLNNAIIDLKGSMSFVAEELKKYSEKLEEVRRTIGSVEDRLNVLHHVAQEIYERAISPREGVG